MLLLTHSVMFGESIFGGNAEGGLVFVWILNFKAADPVPWQFLNFKWLDVLVILWWKSKAVNLLIWHLVFDLCLLDSGWGSRTGGDDRHSVVSHSCRSCHLSNGDASHLPELLLAHPECFAAARWAFAAIMETLYYHNGKRKRHIWCPDCNVHQLGNVAKSSLCFCRRLLGTIAPTWCSCIALRFYWPAAMNPGSEVFTVLPLKFSACRHSTNF